MDDTKLDHIVTLALLGRVIYVWAVLTVGDSLFYREKMATPANVLRNIAVAVLFAIFSMMVSTC
jgi:hypothetical protein